MSQSAKKNRSALKRRHLRVRRKITGTPERPRLVVYRSLRHIYAQVVDDTIGSTLLSVSSMDLKDAKGKNGGNIEAAKEVGALLAVKAKEKSVATVVFDRGGRKYHGRVKALADAVRKGGLKF